MNVILTLLSTGLKVNLVSISFLGVWGIAATSGVAADVISWNKENFNFRKP